MELNLAWPKIQVSEKNRLAAKTRYPIAIGRMVSMLHNEIIVASYTVLLF